MEHRVNNSGVPAHLPSKSKGWLSAAPAGMQRDFKSRNWLLNTGHCRSCPFKSRLLTFIDLYQPISSQS
jgi:hypothetical protein